MNSPQALAELARSTDVWVCASETLGSRFPYKDMLDRDAIERRDGRSVLDGRIDRGPQDRRDGRDLPQALSRRMIASARWGSSRASTPAFSQPNTLIQESVRAFYMGWYKELVTTMPVIENGYVLPMEGPGLGTELLPAVFERSGPDREQIRSLRWRHRR